jgi:4'-phosphopantetheinyl transferase
VIGRVEVWHADPRSFATFERADACLALLDEAERVRLGRFRLEADRTAWLVAHALLRAALSRHAPVDPRRWRFRTTAEGKPFVEDPAAHRDLSFSLAHTAGRVAIAVIAEGPVGVDVEHIGRSGALEEIQDRYLSPLEADALRTAGPGGREERLLAYWTLKEAYVKARGTGLDAHLQGLSFHLDEGPSIWLTCNEDLDEDPGGWTFIRASAGPEHVLALAIQERNAGGVELHEALELPLPY